MSVLQIAPVLIPTSNQSRIEKLFTKLNNKAARFDLPAIVYNFSESYIYENDKRSKPPRVAFPNGTLVCTVTAKGTRPVLSDWTLAARIDLTESDFPVIRLAPDFDSSLPERFRIHDSTCEHCNTNRIRHDVFAVFNKETGEFMRVGRNCLADFIGSEKKASAMLQWFTCMLELESGLSETEFFGLSDGRDYCVTTPAYALAVALRIMKRRQFFTRAAVNRLQEANPESVLPDTMAHRVEQYLFMPDSYHKGQPSEATRRRKEAGNVNSESPEFLEAMGLIEWTLENVTGDSEYVFNLHNLIQASILQARNIPLVVSAIACKLHADNKAAAAAKKAAGPKSAHVGTVKARIDFENVEVINVKLIETQFGTSALHTFRTAQGDLLKWFSSAGVAIASSGALIAFKATIKAHDVWQGENQTALTRVKLITD